MAKIYIEETDCKVTMAKINIKGTDYEVRRDDLNNRDLASADGLCRIYSKEIIVRKKEFMDCDSDYREKHVMRHELIHAIAEECGVSYGENEELVDWIAHIIPHVNKAMDDLKEAGVI